MTKYQALVDGLVGESMDGLVGESISSSKGYEFEFHLGVTMDLGFDSDPFFMIWVLKYF